MDQMPYTKQTVGGMPFWQIFWSQNGAPAKILLATGETLTLKRSGKSRSTR